MVHLDKKTGYYEKRKSDQMAFSVANEKTPGESLLNDVTDFFGLEGDKKGVEKRREDSAI